MWNHWDDYDFWADDNGPPPDTIKHKRTTEIGGQTMCDDFGDWEDFAFIGGLFGLIEEKNKEEKKLRKEMEKDRDESVDE